MKTLVCFDFDGTLTNSDTLFGIILFALGPFRSAWVFLLFLSVFFRYKAGWMNNDDAKAVLFSRVFGGMSQNEFADLCSRYSLQAVPAMQNIVVTARLEEHLSQGHECIIVSASVLDWIAPWALQRGFAAVLSTKAEIRAGVLTGGFANMNCHGDEKVKRIQAYMEEHRYERSACHVIAYGDSSGDDAMLAWADQGFRVKGNVVGPVGRSKESTWARV